MPRDDHDDLYGLNPGIDLRLDIPHCARVYDYLLGGATNFTADRELAGKIMQVLPGAPVAAEEHRLFVERAVRYLAGRGLRQFLDIGAGIPWAPNLHEIVQRAEPRSRVVYLDNDPIVVAHLQAIMISDPDGAVGFVLGDVAQPESILTALAQDGTLDLDRPVALVLGAVVHHLSDEQDPRQVIKTLKAALTPDSALILTHAASDQCPQAMDHIAFLCRQAGVPFHPRSREQVEAFVDGWDLVDPELTTTTRWRPIGLPSTEQATGTCYAAVAVGHDPAPCHDDLNHALSPIRLRRESAADQQGTLMTTHDRNAAYDALTGPAAALYRQLGACPVDSVDAHGMAALTDLDTIAVPQLATILVDAGLLEAVDHGFALYPAGHLHARIMAEESERDEVALTGEGVDRFFAFLRDAARTAERLITPSHRPLWPDQDAPGEQAEPPFALEEAAALDWLEVQLPNYLSVLRFAFLDQRYALVCDLAYSLWPLWLRRRHPEQRYEAQMLGLAAATALADSSAMGQMLTSLAGTIRGTRPVEAYEYDQRAGTHYQETGDTVGLAQAVNGLGKSLLEAGHLDRAEQHFCDAEQLRVSLGDVRGAALSLQGCGLVALARRDAATAAKHLLAAHEALLGVNDAHDGALTLAHHAEALAALGDLDMALVELDTATAELRRTSPRHGQVTAWEIRARILDAAGHSERAGAARERARALMDLTDPDSAARMRGLVAAVALPGAAG